MSDIPFARHRAPEAFPGKAVTDDDEIKNYIKTRAGTAYHPVGTVRMGNDTKAPVTPELAVRGIDRLWVADASVMPRITSANTNAPSMMIGHRAAEFIARVG
jgi:choline dehydrogenase